MIEAVRRFADKFFILRPEDDFIIVRTLSVSDAYRLANVIIRVTKKRGWRVVNINGVWIFEYSCGLYIILGRVT